MNGGVLILFVSAVCGDKSGFKHRFRRDAYATQMRRGIEVVLDHTQILRARRQLGRDVGATQIGV